MKKNRRNNKFIIIGLSFAIYSVNASAALSCSIAATATIAFGVYNPLSAAPLNTSGTLKVTCSGGTAKYQIALNPGNGSSGSYLPRKMLKGASPLNYNIYTNASRTIIWGNSTSGTSVVTGSSKCNTSSLCRHTLYAQVPALQRTATTGAYSDTVVATLTY